MVIPPFDTVKGLPASVVGRFGVGIGVVDVYLAKAGEDIKGVADEVRSDVCELTVSFSL